MVGTGVLMSQLLVEHVLDTTADEENRRWVYASWANTSLFKEPELDTKNTHTHTETHTHTGTNTRNCHKGAPGGLWKLRVKASQAF